ncbi:MAG TPA: hypothetical protein PK636_01000 [bacterium]|nr:hypothetical protein [bacterium]HPJ71244.1 hypothetical protein [bacterium]HPQ65829.1 hypothetical protein [bacterium]
MNGAVLTALLLAAAAGNGNGTPPPAGKVLVLEARDPAGDQDFPVAPGGSYAGGDLTGARLTVAVVEVDRAPQTRGRGHPCLYIPLKLELETEPDLRGGEIQRNIYVSLPPLFIEHIAVRNSFLRGDEQVLLDGERECSFLTGIDPVDDLAVETFRETETYRNCSFDAPFSLRYDSFREASQYSINRKTTYYFPPSESFCWTEIPPLKVSLALSVCETDLGVAGPLALLVADSMSSGWTALSDRGGEALELLDTSSRKGDTNKTGR